MSYLTKLVYVLLLSLVPSFEGRYAIIVGRALNLDGISCLTSASLGILMLSLLLPLVLPLIDKVALNLSQSRISALRKVSRAYESYVRHIREKSSKYVKNKFSYLGLIAFVAIPFPGTGVWTGSLVAYLLGMPKKRTVLSLLTGGLTSNLITFVPTYIALGRLSILKLP